MTTTVLIDAGHGKKGDLMDLEVLNIEVTGCLRRALSRIRMLGYVAASALEIGRERWTDLKRFAVYDK